MTTEDAVGGNTSRSMKNVVEYIRENAAADLTLDALARVAGVTPHHFSLLFTKRRGSASTSLFSGKGLSGPGFIFGKQRSV